MYFHYDHSSRICYITNKGSAFLNTFYYDDKATDLKTVSQFNGKDAIVALGFIPRRFMDTSKTQIAMAAKLTLK